MNDIRESKTSSAAFPSDIVVKPGDCVGKLSSVHSAVEKVRCGPRGKHFKF